MASGGEGAVEGLVCEAEEGARGAVHCSCWWGSGGGWEVDVWCLLMVDWGVMGSLVSLL